MIIFNMNYEFMKYGHFILTFYGLINYTMLTDTGNIQ